MENLPKKVRSKKLSTRVDLTAMVSVSFLLIIFFMVTIELAKPKGIDLSLPDNGDIVCGPIACVDSNRIYTILLDDKNEIITYSGLLVSPLENAKKVNYNQDGIRKELQNKKQSILEYSANLGKPKNGPIVIIKPSEKCNYKNLVDILDEMRIAEIKTYVIENEFTPEESKLLASK
jgi:biopolymer transport protein ExbD